MLFLLLVAEIASFLMGVPWNIRGYGLRLVNKCLYKLGDIDKKLPMSVKLQRCIDLGIPVLIKVPDTCNVWVIDAQLHKLTIDDIIRSELHPGDMGHLARYFYEDEAFDFYQTVKIKPSTLFASTTVDDVEYLQLLTVDIEKLKLSECINVSEFRGVFLFNKEFGQLTLESSVPVNKYHFNPLERYENTLKKRLFDKFKFTCVKLTFVLCDKNTPVKNEFDFPLNDIVSHSAFASECHLEEKSVSKFLFNESEYEQSIYHLEPEYHISLAFLVLSKVAFNFNIKASFKNLDGDYLSRVHGFSSSWGKSGAYLINTFKKTGNNLFIFTSLKELFQKHWIIAFEEDTLALTKELKGEKNTGKSKPSKTARKVKSDKNKAALAKIIKVRAEKVTEDLEDVYGIPSAYATYVELIIRPDKLKNEKTLKANKIKALS